MRMVVSAGNLHVGDILPNGGTIERVWVATNPVYIMYEMVGGGIRTAARASKFEVERS